MTTADRRIASLAAENLGSFSRAQATDAGLTNRQLRRRVQNGSLEQNGPNAFRAPTAPATPISSLRELLLDVGEPLWVGGPSAAALYGLPGYALRRPFHLVLPADRNVRRTGAVIHRTQLLEPIDREHLDGIPITSPARTLVDLARHANPVQLAEAVTIAFERRLTSEAHLHRRIGALRSRGRFGIPLLLEILEDREITAGTESWLEREYLRLVRSAGLPAPRTQVILTKAGARAVRVDCWFEHANLVVELLGYRFHRTREQMNRDAARHNALIAAGRRVFQFTYDQVTTAPAAVVAQTAAAVWSSRVA